jgi:GDSL-like Lipase/Acylhydrolase family
LPLGGMRPPQVDAITADTRLGTVTVGGNDTSYIASLLAYGCANTNNGAGMWTPFVCPPNTTVNRAAIDRQLDALPAQLAELFDRIRNRARHARVLLVTYPQVVPITGSTCPQLALSEEQAAFGRTIGARLELALVRAAAQSDVRLVDLFAPSTLHTACSQQPWVSGWEWGGFPIGTIAYHPTPSGMTAAAQRIIASLR